jgi:hypothetical protein
MQRCGPVDDAIRLSNARRRGKLAGILPTYGPAATYKTAWPCKIIMSIFTFIHEDQAVISQGLVRSFRQFVIALGFLSNEVHHCFIDYRSYRV